MSEIELTYFPIHGFRGLLARMVLDLSDLKYIENVIQFQDWPANKPSKILHILAIIDRQDLWTKDVILRKFNGIPTGTKSRRNENGSTHADACLPFQGKAQNSQ